MRNSILAFKLVLAFIPLLIASGASAKPQYYNTLMSKFPKIGSTTKCLTCHGGRGLNFFGFDVAKYALINGRLDISKVVELDSDKDGLSNSQELSSGTNPGVPENKSK